MPSPAGSWSVPSKCVALSCAGRSMPCAVTAFPFAAEELERTIRQLRSRIKKIAFAERGLSSALPDYVDTGQLSLPLDGGDAP